jgi:hypothetical protein
MTAVDERAGSDTLATSAWPGQRRVRSWLGGPRRSEAVGDGGGLAVFVPLVELQAGRCRDRRRDGAPTPDALGACGVPVPGVGACLARPTRP